MEYFYSVGALVFFTSLFTFIVWKQGVEHWIVVPATSVSTSVCCLIFLDVTSMMMLMIQSFINAAFPAVVFSQHKQINC